MSETSQDLYPTDNFQTIGREEFLQSFSGSNAKAGITTIFGGAASGKTTASKDLLKKLFTDGVISSYASLIASQDNMIRSYTANGHMVYSNEYAPSERYQRKPIHVVYRDNVIISAFTEADVIILPEIRNAASILLLNIARKTGKPIFLELHGHDVDSAIQRLRIIDESVDTGVGVLEQDDLSVEHYSWSDPFLTFDLSNDTDTRNEPLDVSELTRFIQCEFVPSDSSYERTQKYIVA